MIFRLTHKLAKKIDSLDALNDLALDENPYLDWSANLFRADRLQYIMLTNTMSLYSMIMFGRGITDNDSFIKCSLDVICDFLERDGNEFIYRRFIEPNISTIMFAKSLNQSATGSMNELIYQARYHLECEEISPLDASFRINDVPMKFLNYDQPVDVFRSMAVKS